MNTTHIKMYHNKAQKNGKDFIQCLNLHIDFREQGDLDSAVSSGISFSSLEDTVSTVKVAYHLK